MFYDFKLIQFYSEYIMFKLQVYKIKKFKFNKKVINDR